MKLFPNPLTPEEERFYLERYREGDGEARQILIERNMRLVAHLVKKYHAADRDMEDLISVGTIGLIKAVNTFNTDKNNRLAAYASKCVENAILSQMRLWFQTSTPQSRKEPKWRILAQVSENIYILCSTSDGYVRYAPMYIHSFRLIAPRKLLEAQLFNQQYQNYEDIPTVQDRLRWCRHHMGLMQKEVADMIGITRGHYIDFEVGYVDYYPKEIVDKLAALYQVPVDDLLDDYNRFLYQGQGKMIREYRESLGLKKKQFARLINLDPGTLRCWENDQKRMFKDSWEKYFKDIIKV